MAFKVSENVKNIINVMRELIENEKAIRIKEDKKGWKYGGPEFKSSAVCLKEKLINEGYNVSDAPVTLGKFAYEKQGPWMYCMAFLSGREYQKSHKRLDIAIDKRNSDSFPWRIFDIRILLVHQGRTLSLKFNTL